MQQRDSVISSRGTNARRRKIGGCPAYVAHKGTAAIGDVFSDIFITMQRAGLADSPTLPPSSVKRPLRCSHPVDDDAFREWPRERNLIRARRVINSPTTIIDLS